MPSGPSAPVVRLSLAQREQLVSYQRKPTISRQMHQRITIILQAHEGKTNLGIARRLGVASNTVKKWRNRWVANYEQLGVYQQQTERTSEHLSQMLSLLRDEARSGAPIRISLAEKQGLMALACKKPEDFGIPMTQWNREILTQVAQEQGIVKKISPRYVGKLLKNPRTTTP